MSYAVNKLISQENTGRIFPDLALFLLMEISQTHLVSVRQKCVSRDFFVPVASTRNMQHSTWAVTPRLGASEWSTEVAATNRGPDEGSDLHVLQVERLRSAGH